MSVTLALKGMSREDKLRAMEALWAHLSGDDAQFDSPAWHADALRQATQLVRAGKAKFSSWETAGKGFGAKPSALLARLLEPARRARIRVRVRACIAKYFLMAPKRPEAAFGPRAR